MMRIMLNGKIHNAVVTQTEIDYEGSITIDEALIEAAGMLVNEKVSIYNITNGNRFETYIIHGERDSGIIGLNGAAARLCDVGDRIIIAGYALYSEDELKAYKPNIIVITDNENKKFYTK